jgi:uncharacterized protein (TIGR02996 family)
VVKIEDVRHWLKLRGDRGVHILASQASGWYATVCGTWTPNGEHLTERPKRVCPKCRAERANVTACERAISEASALLRAVVATKADDAPRQVLADWLEERGLPHAGLLRAAEPWQWGKVWFWFNYDVDGGGPAKGALPREVFAELRGNTGRPKAYYRHRRNALADLACAVCEAAGVAADVKWKWG